MLMQDEAGKDIPPTVFARGNVRPPRAPLVTRGRRVVETYHYTGNPDWKVMIKIVDIIVRNTTKDAFTFQRFTDSGVKTAFLLAREGFALWGALYQPFFDVYLRKLLTGKVGAPAIPRRVKQRRAAIMVEVHRELERKASDEYLFMRPRRPEERTTEYVEDPSNEKVRWTQRNRAKTIPRANPKGAQTARKGEGLL